jgi:hypothetical protein
LGVFFHKLIWYTLGITKESTKHLDTIITASAPAYNARVGVVRERVVADHFGLRGHGLELVLRIRVAHPLIR